MSQVYFSNKAAITTLSQSMTNASTSLVVGTTSGWPTSFPFYVSVEPDTANEEIMQVTSGAGTVGTPYVVSRGVSTGNGGTWDSVAAVAHNAAVTVQHRVTAGDFKAFRDHEALSESAHTVTSYKLSYGSITSPSQISTAATSETVIGSLTIAAADLLPNRCYRFTVAGTSNNTAVANTLTLRVRFGTSSAGLTNTAYSTFVITAPTSVQNGKAWEYMVDLQGLAYGAGTSLMAIRTSAKSNMPVTPTSQFDAQTSSGTLDFTVAQYLTVTAIWSASGQNVTNVMTLAERRG